MKNIFVTFLYQEVTLRSAASMYIWRGPIKEIMNYYQEKNQWEHVTLQRSYIIEMLKQKQIHLYFGFNFNKNINQNVGER